jgi:hypothetical protein
MFDASGHHEPQLGGFVAKRAQTTLQQGSLSPLRTRGNFPPRHEKCRDPGPVLVKKSICLSRLNFPHHIHHLIR